MRFIFACLRLRETVAAVSDRGSQEIRRSESAATAVILMSNVLLPNSVFFLLPTFPSPLTFCHRQNSEIHFESARPAIAPQ